MTEASERTALYRVWGEADLLLYVGISKNFGYRWKRHAKERPWWREMRRLAVDEWFDSREEAELAEVAAIRAEHPKHNKKHNTAQRCPQQPRRKQATRAATRPVWIDGGDGVGWSAPLPPMPRETPEQVAALRAAWRYGSDGNGYA